MTPQEKIKYQGMSPQEAYEDISIRQAFEWVKTRHWSLRDFNEWVKAQQHKHFQEGYREGYSNGYETGLDDERC